MYSELFLPPSTGAQAFNLFTHFANTRLWKAHTYTCVCIYTILMYNITRDTFPHVTNSHFFSISETNENTVQCVSVAQYNLLLFWFQFQILILISKFKFACDWIQTHSNIILEPPYSPFKSPRLPSWSSLPHSLRISLCVCVCFMFFLDKIRYENTP